MRVRYIKWRLEMRLLLSLLHRETQQTTLTKKRETQPMANLKYFLT